VATLEKTSHETVASLIEELNNLEWNNVSFFTHGYFDWGFSLMFRSLRADNPVECGANYL